MDPINLWLDPNEVRQLAEQLIRPVAKPQISSADLGFDSGFVGFVGNDPLVEAEVPSVIAPPIITLPLTNPSNDLAIPPDHDERTGAMLSAASPAPAAHSIPPLKVTAVDSSTVDPTATAHPPAFKFSKIIHHSSPPEPATPTGQTRLVPLAHPSQVSSGTVPATPKEAVPIPTLIPVSKLVVAQPPVLAVTPATHQGQNPRPQPFRLVGSPKPSESPPVTPAPAAPTTLPSRRMSVFRDWLTTSYQLTEVFITDRDGQVIYDDSTFNRLHFMAKNLAKTAGTPENVRLRISPKEILELIPCSTEQGTIVLSTVVSDPLPQEHIRNISSTLKQTISPS